MVVYRGTVPENDVHLLYAVAASSPATTQTIDKHTQERLPLATYSSYLRRNTRVRRSSSLKYPPSAVTILIPFLTIDPA